MDSMEQDMKSMLLLAKTGNILAGEQELLMASFLREENQSVRFSILNDMTIKVMSIFAEQYDETINTPSPEKQAFNNFNDAYLRAKNNGAPLNILLLLKKLNDITEKNLSLDEECLITCIALYDSYAINNEREFKIKSFINAKLKIDEHEFNLLDDKLPDTIKLFFILSGVIKFMMFDLSKPLQDMAKGKAFNTKF